MRIPSSINSLLKQLFPLPVGIKLKGTREEFYRARSLTVLLLTISATVWFWTAVLCLVYFFTHLNILLNIYFGLIISALLGLQVWSFFRFANIRLTSMLFTLTYFLMALSLVLMSGGYRSASLAILLTSPVVSFKAGGKDEGIMNAIFVGLAGIALMATDKMGIPMVNQFAGIDEGFLFVSAWVVTLAVISTCLVTYDMDE